MDQPNKSGETIEGPCPGMTWADEVNYELQRVRDLIDAAEYVFSRLKNQINLWGEGDIIAGLFVLMEEHAVNAKRASDALCRIDEISNDE